ncbi:DNA polymerase eta isoform X5 [Halyomorpha halys]|uniref:DNA polymerase eta isoform X5 n=1 Tax=Halyomorpha halys TaxID=286706 RepID=UPI0006D4E45A|nr:DNA polymerase eta isoform X3 [Halyomorpha halys]
MTERVISLIDMDCFYCQVEARLNPSLKGHPMAVIQYNQWKGGGIIAVNYEARDKGVTRFMRGDDAKKHCPEIILVSVPTVREKADLTRYRDAGREVLAILCKFSTCVQRASVDEAYIDLTKAVEERMKLLSQFNPEKWKSTFVVGYSTNSSNDEGERKNGLRAWLKDTESLNNTASLRLAVGALIVEEIRETVLSETGFKCSAGIAHNKILAKLACGLHKPNRQTILPLECVLELYKTLPVKKIKNLGGKLGNNVVEKLGCQTMSDLLKFSEKELQAKYDEKTGSWLYNIARGLDNEPVTARLVAKSIGCCKNFPGRTALIKTKDVHHWISKLAEELSERLLEDEVMNKRRANLLTVSMHLEINKKDTASSKSVALSSYEVDKIFFVAEQTLKKVCKVDPSNDNCEDSQGSMVKAVDENRETPNESQKDNIKRKLFCLENDDTELEHDVNKQKSKTDSKTDFVNERSVVNLNEKPAKKKNTLINFFNQNIKQEEWVKPEELFPDISQIDDELLKALPSSYRNKIMKLRESIKHDENLNTEGQDIPINIAVNNTEKVSNLSSIAGNSSIKCEECGEIVDDYELHQDMHIAMKLDKELNSIPRVVNSANAITKNNNDNKRKLKTSGKKKNSNNKKSKSIDMFFKK